MSSLEASDKSDTSSFNVSFPFVLVVWGKGGLGTALSVSPSMLVLVPPY